MKNPMLKNRKTMGLLLVAVVAISLVIVGIIRKGSSSDSGLSSLKESQLADFLVRRGSFDIIVMANGELGAKEQTELRCRVEGSTSIIEVLPEGTSVQKDEIVVRLADDKIKEKIEQALLSVEQAKADKLASEQDDAIEQNEAESNLKAAALKLEMSLLDLEKWTKGDDPKKKRNLSLAVQRGERQLTRAKEDLISSEQLFKEEFISESELEDDRLDLIEAEAGLQTAQLDVTVYEQYTRPKERKKVESDVEQARAELERTKRRNQSKLTRSRAKLQGKTRQLSIHESRLAKHEEQLANTIIRASQSGLVVYATSIGSSRRRRGDPIAQGRQVRFNEILIVLPDTSQMVAQLKVHESLINQVKLGQQVWVRMDASSDQPVQGKVTEISVMAEDGGWLNPDLREYTIKVDLPGNLDEQKFKPAMRCSGEVMIGRAEDVLMIPIQAVVTIGRQHFCFIRHNGKVQQQAITLGRTNQTMVEITEGLKEGNRILLKPPAISRSSATDSHSDAKQSSTKQRRK